MKRSSADETDLVLISALQDAPRAKWADLGRILEMGEDGLAERWRRMSSAGLAWICLVDQQHVRRSLVTFVQLTLSSEHRHGVVEQLLHDPVVRTIHHTSGRHNIVLLVETEDLSQVAALLDSIPGNARGVVVQDVLPAVGGIVDAAQWRTAALSPAQRRELAALDRLSSDASTTSTWVGSDAVATALLDELAVDGRASTAELVRTLRDKHGLESSPSTVARKLSRLLRLPDVRIRCEVSAADLGWQAVVILWCRISSDEAERLCSGPTQMSASTRQQLPEVRSILVLAGSVNLHVTVWLHSLDSLPNCEVRLGEWLSSLEICDRSVVLSTEKRMGYALSADGRRSQYPDGHHTKLASWTAVR